MNEDRDTKRIIGFIGTHRTGKTTTAQDFADAINATFVPMNVGFMLKSIGVSNDVYYPFDKRLDIQFQVMQQIMNGIHDALEGYEGLIVVDRTPIDALAYTLVAVDNTITSVTNDYHKIILKQFKEWVSSFIHDNLFFSVQVLMTDAIGMVEDEWKTGTLYTSFAYRQAIEVLITGIVHGGGSAPSFTIPYRITGRERRVNWLKNITYDLLESNGYRKEPKLTRLAPRHFTIED